MASQRGKFLQTTSVFWVTDRIAQLRRELIYQTADGKIIAVPAGFRTDGASIPPGLQWVLNPWGGKYPKAAAIHDYLYVRLNNGEPHAAAYTRAEADNVFLEVMRTLHVNWLTAILMFLGVRIGGGQQWLKDLTVAKV